MKISSLFKILGSITAILSIWSCEMSFLDAKPNKAILVPTTLEQYQAILDNARDVMNNTPYLGEVSADDFNIIETTFDSYSGEIQNAYIWSERIYTTSSTSNWDLPYKQIFYANVVLDGLEANLTKNENAKILRGMALFYRGWAYFQLAQLFAAPYNPTVARNTKGLPLRLNSDITLAVKIGNLDETYRRIRVDLAEAISILPTKQPVPTRPTKAAAYALLARLNLVLRDYNQAKLYADSTLALQYELLDFNTIDSLKAQPFPDLYLNANKNPEVIFLTTLIPNSYLGTTMNTVIDSSLYASYSDNDLRKTMFFNTQKQFRGSYMGQRAYVFSGLAVDEILLTRAEANVRTGNNIAALSDINNFRLKRYKTDNYAPIITTISAELLQIILQERRKELVGRGLRWGDLKRLNDEPPFKRELKRKIKGTEYILVPNDHRYALPFPDAEIKEKS